MSSATRRRYCTWRVVGVCGILVAAKRRGLIAAVRPSLDQLRSNGFRLHADVRRLVLESVNEIDE
ncbi:MAG: DUF3368 domain-containing protein [Phycisphaerae bacterium]